VNTSNGITSRAQLSNDLIVKSPIGSQGGQGVPPQVELRDS